MSQIIKEGICSTHELQKILILVESSNLIFSELKMLINNNGLKQASYFDATQNHMYDIYNFRYQNMVAMNTNQEIISMVGTIVKKMESNDYKIIRLTFLKSNSGFTFWIFSNSDYTELIGTIKLPTIKGGEIF